MSELREQFKRIYNEIIDSHDECKMQVLGSVTKAMMCDLIDSDPKQAQEYLDKLEAVNWDNYLTEQEAANIYDSMNPAPLWSRAEWDKTMRANGYDMEHRPHYNAHALFVTMDMITSDSGDTIRKKMADMDDMFNFVHQLALDKLRDKDGRFEVRKYFDL